MNLVIPIALLAFVGLGETIYLISTRLLNAKLACLAGWSCEYVLGSKYGRLFFGIKNDIVGFLFYLSVIVLMGALMLNAVPALNILGVLRATLLVGAAMSLMLTFIQWKLLKAWCTWCVLSALVNWGMVILSVAL